MTFIGVTAKLLGGPPCFLLDSLDCSVSNIIFLHGKSPLEGRKEM
jgi:hypothetical protein